MRNSVLFVGAFPTPATLDRFVSGDLAQRLEGRGWIVKLTSRQPGRLLRFLGIISGTLLHARHCDVAAVDVFSGAAFWWAEAAVAVLRALRKPYILVLHGGNLPQFCQRHSLRARKLLTSAVAVTCPSAYLAQEMRTYRSDLLLIPNGINVCNYRFRQKVSLGSNLVWLRAFHQIYNPKMAVEALALLRQSGRQARLTMIGPDKGDGSLHRAQAAAARLAVEGDIVFRTAINKTDVPDELGRADVFLNTTNFDNTPVSVIEAMACGLPVVSTNVGGIPYLLRHRESALLVPSSNPAAMAEAVNELCTSADLARRLSLNGRRLVEQFDWGIVLPEWEALLHRVVATGRGPAR